MRDTRELEKSETENNVLLLGSNNFISHLVVELIGRVFRVSFDFFNQ